MPNLQEGDHVPVTRSRRTLARRVRSAVSKRIDACSANLPQTKSVLATIGRAEKGRRRTVNSMEILVDVNDPATWPQKMTMAALSEAMQDKISEDVPYGWLVGGGAAHSDARRGADSGSGATLALKVYGRTWRPRRTRGR